MESNPLTRAFDTIRRLRAQLNTQSERQLVAVVGVGLRFPGAIDTLDSYWEALAGGRDLVSTLPAARRAPFAAAWESLPVAGGFLDDVAGFDAGFFGISPREARALDPQQRLLMEVVWEALEHGALAPERLRKVSAGLYLGITSQDYRDFQCGPGDAYWGTGNGHCFAAGRVAYTLGLSGPALAVDTACSSSLVAVHLACQALRRGECEIALAGGVNLILSPRSMQLGKEMRALAPDGRCKAFDARANGISRGEGCGVVVLKRLDHAERDGDRILAVIRGSAVNHDGRSSGFTAPNVRAQIALLQAALADAGVSAADVGLIEAHGTGTSLGDPIEMEALVHALGRQNGEAPLHVGSVKTNFGHLEAAAGIAGLLKALLCLERRLVPPLVHFGTLNPRIDLTGTGIRLSKQLCAWERTDRGSCAGVSSFGMSGTNAHVILAPAPGAAGVPPRAPEATALGFDTSANTGLRARPLGMEARTATREQELECPCLLTLSAHDPSALAQLAARWAAHLTRAGEGSWQSSCRTAGLGRTHFKERLALVASSAAEASELLGRRTADADLRLMTGSAEQGLRVGFLYSGQGAQQRGMGAGLCRAYPTFARAWRECAAVYEGITGADLDGVNEQAGHASESTQPLLFALQVSLTELWAAWGITPTLVCGHSLGELAASVAAGTLELAQGMRLATERGRLMQRHCRAGRMIAVRAELVDIEAFVREHDELEIVAYNGPRDFVLGCDLEACEALVQRLGAAGHRPRLLQVSHAYHSRSMEPALAPLRQASAALAYAAPQRAWISTLTGDYVRTAPDAAHWVRHARQPVRFATALGRAAAGADVWIELGPHPSLLALAASSGRDEFARARRVPSLRRGRDERRALLEAAAALYVAGASVALDSLLPAAPTVSAPTYPFQRQRYWVEVAPELPGQVELAREWYGTEQITPGADRHFRVTLAAGVSPFDEHLVHGEPVVPGAYSLAAFLALARRVLGVAQPVVTDVQWSRALRLTSQPTELYFSAYPRSEGRTLLSMSVRDGATFVEYARALLRPEQPELEPARDGCFEQLLGADEVYALIARAGVELGPAFRWIEELALDARGACARLRAPQDGGELDGGLSPTLLDACLQTAAAAISAAAAVEEAFLPLSVDRVRFMANGSPPARCVAHLRRPLAGARSDHDSADHYTADLTLLDSEGAPLLALEGLVFRRATALQLSPASELLSCPAWLPVERAVGGSSQPLQRFHLLGGDDARALAAELEKRGATVSLAPLEEAGLARQSSWAERSREEQPDVVLVAPGGRERQAGRTQQLSFQLARLARELDDSGRRLTVLSRGLYAGEGDHAGALFGCVRALRAERRRLPLAIIDLPLGAVPLGDVARELCEPADELCLTLQGGQRLALRWQPLAGIRDPGLELAGDAVYLVTGGTGGLGREVASWLVEHGARRLVLAARSAAECEAAPWVHALRTRGVELTLRSYDLAQPGAARELVQRCGTLGALRGIVHAAGVTRDDLLERQTPQHFEAVFAPKADAAWELHEASAGLALDFFVLFSSLAAWLGVAGQVNYAAANGALDQLARARRALGLPALSAQWGPWADAGMAERVDAATRRRGTALGLRPLSPAQALSALGAAISSAQPVVTIAAIDWQRLASTADADLAAALAHMPTVRAASRVQHPSPQQRVELATMSREQASAWLQARLIALVRASLGFSPEMQLPMALPLRELGLDSLMAVDIRSQLCDLTGLVLPATLMFEYPTLDALVRHIVGQVHPEQEPAPQAHTDDSGLASFERELSSLERAELGALMDATLAELAEGSSR